MQTTTTPLAAPANALPGYQLYNYAPALHESIKEVLRLTAAERDTCAVLAMGSDFWPGEKTGKLAIARPIAREAWGKLAPGQVLIYTTIYHVPESEMTDEETPGDYNTGCGALVVNDPARAMLYAERWEVSEWDAGLRSDTCVEGLPFDTLAEVYVVERFLEVIQQLGQGGGVAPVRGGAVS